MSLTSLARLALATCSLAWVTPALADGTAAGTSIENTASASYNVGATPKRIDSNTVTFRVDELIDVTLTSDDATDIAVRPDEDAAVLTFTVANTGNGNETFTLAVVDNGTGDEFDPETTTVYLDTNNDGTYTPGVDTAYLPGTNDPDLAPGGQIRVFIVSDIPAAGVDDGDRSEVSLNATANTGSGASGTVFAGAGTAGVDAVVGATSASASGSGFYLVNDVTVALVKSAVIVDQFGGDQPIPGATVTYTITATVSGTGTATGLVISDPVPANTLYVANSITLDTIAQTDVADVDAALQAAGMVTVALGDVASGTSKAISFKVTIE